MQLLYETDLLGLPPGEEPVESYEARLDELADGDAEVRKFVDRLVRGTLEHRQDIDAVLQAVARNWEIRRMAVVDRNILRMAVFELTWCADIPAKVSINEAIELGKKFSTANSGGFANGILDRVRIDLDTARVEGSDGSTVPGAQTPQSQRDASKEQALPEPTPLDPSTLEPSTPEPSPLDPSPLDPGTPEPPKTTPDQSS